MESRWNAISMIHGDGDPHDLSECRGAMHVNMPSHNFLTQDIELFLYLLYGVSRVREI